MSQADWLKDSAQKSLRHNTAQWQQVDPVIRQKIGVQLGKLPAFTQLGSVGQSFILALEQGSEQLPTLLKQFPQEDLGQFLEQTEAYFYQSPQDERMPLKALLNLCASTLFVAS